MLVSAQNKVVTFARKLNHTLKMRKYYNLCDNPDTHLNVLQNFEQEAEDGTPQMLLPKYYTVALQDMEESPVTTNRSVLRKRFKTSPK
jgi:hypothetical protein